MIVHLLYLVLGFVHGDDYTWNTAILTNPPWKLENCDQYNHTDCFDNQKVPVCYKNCTGFDECKISVAVILPKDHFYTVDYLKKSVEMLNKSVTDAKNNQILDARLNFEFDSFDDKCDPVLATTSFMSSTYDLCPNVFFGPACDYCLAPVGRVSQYIGNHGVPMITPGGFTFDFTKKKTECGDEFHMVINAGPADFVSFGEFLHLILDRYKLRKVALLYDDEQTQVAGSSACYLFIKSLVEEIKSIDKFQYADGNIKIYNNDYTMYIKTVIGTQYGIILTCTSQAKLREFAIEAYKMNLMERGEYTIFNFATYINESKPWFDPTDTDERNRMAMKGFQSIYTFAPVDDAIAKSDTSERYLTSLYDAMLMYIHALNRTITKEKRISMEALRGYKLVQEMTGMRFKGKDDQEVLVNCNGQKVANYSLLHVNSSGEYECVAQYSTEHKTITSWNVQWLNGDPLDSPTCGYDMSLCPPKYDTVKILLISLILVLLLGVLVVGFILYRGYKLKKAVYSMVWKVHYDDILFFPVKSRSSFQSMASLRRGSDQTYLEDGLSMAGDRQLYTTVGFYKTIRVAVKYLQDVKIELNHDQLKELKAMKDLSHDNLLKFYGACVDIPNCLLTEYCAKGSLQDILENDNYKLDSTFKMSLIMDLIRGMHYLHHSVIKSHGALKSTNCLVDSRFVLKISDFGLDFLRKHSKEIDNDIESHSYWERKLWTAPELLRMENPPARGTQKGDVYSFAIIMHEIIVREGVFYLQDTRTPKEKVEAVRKGPGGSGGDPLRPFMGDALCEEEVALMMKKCYAEDSADRPDFSTLKSKLRHINKESDGNLLDNLLARMEQYANNLESLVEERTADYLEEKRKCEELLYQLLPKSVAQQLIVGESVIAETFEHVTIHFSDIVGFTTLSAGSTPLQVVEFLNDLYTCFDSIIEHFDVYKVETIGDSYMVVSGLPVRNGNMHAREIARMSLALLKAVKTFKIRHRPDERLQLRIGIHTGPCVAGVVGSKMPRYCLFGDTVNTASRMETNGLPLRIHISPVTKQFLDKFRNFDIEFRGEVELKGKGKMLTYWLNGEKEEVKAPPAAACAQQPEKRIKPPSTPVPQHRRKPFSNNGQLLNQMHLMPEFPGEEAELPLLSITSSPDYKSNA